MWNVDVYNFIMLIYVIILVSGAGIRYISEDLIRKVSRQDHLESITVLNLTLGREGGKKIKVEFYCKYGELLKI